MNCLKHQICSPYPINHNLNFWLKLLRLTKHFLLSNPWRYKSVMSSFRSLQKRNVSSVNLPCKCYPKLQPTHSRKVTWAMLHNENYSWETTVVKDFQRICVVCVCEWVSVCVCVLEGWKTRAFCENFRDTLMVQSTCELCSCQINNMLKIQWWSSYFNFCISARF